MGEPDSSVVVAQGTDGEPRATHARSDATHTTHTTHIRSDANSYFDGGDVSGAPPPPTFRERFCPRLAVYFPKYVSIQNGRLFFTYWTLVAMVVIAIALYFIMNNRYQILKDPKSKFSLCDIGCRMNASVFDQAIAADSGLCAGQTKEIDYWRDNHTRYHPTECVKRCGSGTQFTDFTCIDAADLVQIEEQVVFIPTYYKETMITKRPAVGGCEQAPVYDRYAKIRGDRCVREREFLVPGVPSASVSLFHEFMVAPEITAWTFFLKDKTAHSLSTESQGLGSKGLLSVLIDFDGNQLMEWAPGELITLSVKTLLMAANYDEIGQAEALDLDKTYRRPGEGIPKNQDPNGVSGLEDERDATVRLTGATLTVDLHYTDSDYCHHYELDKNVKVDHSGPICCLFVHAERMWTKSDRAAPIGIHGSVQYRQQHGIRVKFRPLGSIKFWDMTLLLNNMTVAFVWLQIPLMVLYFFSIFCLGHLSKVYSRVIHQDVNLVEQCKGLAARLVSHSAAFHALQDTYEGISKNKMLTSFQKILEHNKEIDDDEVSNFVDFVFAGMNNMSHANASRLERATINIQEYCQACASNEPLGFDALAVIFDKDRKIGFLEQCMLDKSIKRVITSARRASETEVRKASAKVDMQAGDINKTKMQLENIMKQVAEIDVRMDEVIKQVGEATSPGSAVLCSKAEQAAAERRFKDVDLSPRSNPPKDDQNESNCSILDEEDRGRDV